MAKRRDSRRAPDLASYRKERLRREALATELQARAEQQRAEVRAKARATRTTPKRGHLALADVIEVGLEEGRSKRAPLYASLFGPLAEGGSLPRYKGLPHPLKRQCDDTCTRLLSKHPHTKIEHWVRGRLLDRLMPDLPAAIEADIDTLAEIVCISAPKTPKGRWETYLGRRGVADLDSILQHQRQKSIARRPRRTRKPHSADVAIERCLLQAPKMTWKEIRRDVEQGDPEVAKSINKDRVSRVRRKLADSQ